jgi:hypothetical protein
MATSKYNILLDLDQTLISAEAEEEYDFEKNREKAKKFEFRDMDGYYIVFERPGLQPFLDFLFKNFNVSIWTAASKDYALFIVEKIILQNKPERKLDWIFFSYHCDLSKKIKKGSKNLNMLWDEYKIPGYNKNNTLIIDDYDEVYETQPNNCIIAAPFEFSSQDSENDEYLYKLQTALQKTSKSGKLAKKINKTLKSSN